MVRRWLAASKRQPIDTSDDVRAYARRTRYHHIMRRLLAVLTLFAAGCVTTSQPPVRFKILQINDVYKIEGLEGGQVGGLARVRTLRKLLESDGTRVLVMHGGDEQVPGGEAGRGRDESARRRRREVRPVDDGRLREP